MSFFEHLETVLAAEDHSEHAFRICAQIRYGAYLSKALNGKYQKELDDALAILHKSLVDFGTVTPEASLEAEKALLPLQGDAKKYRVHLVAHAHIDMNWMWGYGETAAVTAKTFRTMLDLMNRYPDFTFSQSQASTYEILEKYDPQMLEEVKARILEGRWELSSLSWVEHDDNMPSEESIARHILYTGRYYRALFGKDVPLPEVYFQPDTFGHTAALPSICAAGGVKYLYHCRGDSSGQSAYVWRDGAGAELLCYCDPYWYTAGISPETFTRVPGVCERYGMNCYLTVYGVGDHGGGPSARDIEQILKLQSYPIMPTLVFSSYRAFFKELESVRKDLPVLTGERNFIFSGCYSSQSEIKKNNRLGESRLYEAEAISAMAHFAGARPQNPIFESAWRKVLFSQFHDILPGSCVKESREYASGIFQEAMAGALCAAHSAQRTLADAIDARGLTEEAPPLGAGAGFGSASGSGCTISVPSTLGGKKRAFHLFNLTGRDFEGAVEVTVWDWPYDGGRAFFTDANKSALQSVFLAGNRGYWGHEYKSFLVNASIPALGYTTCVLDERERTDLPAIPYFANRVGEFPQSTVTLENALVRAVFDRTTGALRSFTDKASEGELLGETGGCFYFAKEDAGAGMTAWKEGTIIERLNINETSPVRVKEQFQNALRGGFAYECVFAGDSTLRVRFTLDEGEKFLRCTVDCFFGEKGGNGVIPRLEAGFALAGKTEKWLCGVPLGVCERACATHDLPANFAAPAWEEAALPILISGGSYGFGCKEKELSLTLLRAGYDPDPLPEYGNHRISFAFGASGAGKRELLAANERFRHLPAVCPATSAKGSLPTEMRFVKIENAELIALKTAEDGAGTVLRLASFSGREERCRVVFNAPVKAAFLCDLSETPEKELALDGNSVTTAISPCQILTMKITE